MSSVPAAQSVTVERQRVIEPLTGLLLALGGLLLALPLLMFTNGDFAGAVRFSFYLIALLLALFRPTLSLLLLIGSSFSISEMLRGDSWTYDWKYHWAMKLISPTFAGISFTPMELHLILVIVGMIIHLRRTRQEMRRVVAFQPALIYFGAVVLSVVYGLWQGGEFYYAFWEIRGKVYLLAFMVVVSQLIRTEEEVRAVVWVLLGSMAFKAMEVATLYINAGWSVGEGGWGDHADAGFLATAFLFLAALLHLKAHRSQRVYLLATLPLLVLAFIASDRRTVYAVLIGGAIAYLFLLGRETQRKILRHAAKVAAVVVVYLGVFWNSNSFIASPARSLRMAFASDEEEAGSTRYQSNLYRKVENYNLAQMVRKNPIAGVGYGVPLDYSAEPMPVFWELGIFIPHNETIGVATKMGVVGYIAFWFFYLSAIVEVSSGFAWGNNAYHKALLALVLASIINHIVYGFFDIMLTFYRTNIYLGTMLGIASAVAALDHKGGGVLPGKQGAGESKKEEHHHWILDRW